MLKVLQKAFPNIKTLSSSEEILPYLTEWRNRFDGKALCVMLPENTSQVSEIVKYCNEHKIGIVPQGGNTGLVGGQIPDKSGNQIILSLKRMDKILDISLIDGGITVESGVILKNLHEKLESTNMMFPLRLASEGSAQIGGLISTNAGGTAVLKYGMMKELVFGLEVVLSDGSVLNDLHYLRKNNRGFAVSSLFCGTEGIFGIITKASLKIFPKPKQEYFFLVACNDLQKITDFFLELKLEFSEMIAECELIPQIGFEFVDKHYNLDMPFKNFPQWGCLVTIALPFKGDFFQEKIEGFLEKSLRYELIIDALMAQNLKQAETIRSIRLNLSEAQKFEGASLKHDISVPIKYIAEFTQKAIDKIKSVLPEIRPVIFGHIGDGNLHFNLSQPIGMDKQEFMAYETQMNDIIFDLVHHYQGSFSAEHGIGQLRIEALKKYTSPEHQRIHNLLKKSLDEKNILNPNKIIKG